MHGTVNNNILEAIGNTPIVKLNDINPYKNVTMYGKLEGFNPTGSIKDRIALEMINQAEVNGELTKDKTIVEATSGNTGISLAMIGCVKGYDVKIVMSEAVSVERRKIIAAFGAEVILTPKDEGTDGAIRFVANLIEHHGDTHFCTNQFSNKYNKLAHYSNTAIEIWEQTNGKITHFVSSLGTSGTIMGVGTGLKEKNPDIKIIEAHPEKGHYIQGLKNMDEAIVPSIYNPDMIDISIMIDSEKAFETARQLAKKEGIFAGMSSGAAMLCGLEAAKKIPSDEEAVMVIIFPDRGEKYLSTKLFE
ncbi:MAG: PLP-dependent cysteine synthase family protein [Methanobacteriaceae archaeon]